MLSREKKMRFKVINCYQPEIPVLPYAGSDTGGHSTPVC